MATTNETARSGRTETLEQVLNRIQRMLVSDGYHHYFLMGDDWDWLVVLQCLQDNGHFKSHPKRPPFAELVRWLTEHHVPHYYAHYDARKLSNAYKKIGGAVHPWTNVDLSPHMLLRWRDLYFNLDKMLKALSNHE